MRKLLMTVLVSTVFMSGFASASVTLLTGAVHIANTGSFKVNHTVEYNAVYGNPASCEEAKTEAIERIVNLYPADPGAGNFYKAVTLTCTAKTLAE